MDYKSILVHLDRGAKSAARLEIGFALAAAVAAHPTGLFALSSPPLPPPPPPPRPGAAGAEGGGGEPEARYRAQALRSAEVVFRAAAARHGRAKSEWRASARDAPGAGRRAGRHPAPGI